MKTNTKNNDNNNNNNKNKHMRQSGREIKNGTMSRKSDQRHEHNMKPNEFNEGGR